MISQEVYSFLSHVATNHTHRYQCRKEATVVQHLRIVCVRRIAVGGQRDIHLASGRFLAVGLD